jgi:hypothetical protein
MAQVWLVPIAIELHEAFLPGSTCTAETCDVVDPNPSCPEPFCPQHQSESLLAMPHALDPPAAICCQVWLLMFTGTLLLASKPRPSRAPSLEPQQDVEPFICFPHVKSAPEASEIQSLPVGIASGVVWGVVLPSPSSPNELSPQHQSELSERVAQVCA